MSRSLSIRWHRPALRVCLCFAAMALAAPGLCLGQVEAPASGPASAPEPSSQPSATTLPAVWGRDALDGSGMDFSSLTVQMLVSVLAILVLGGVALFLTRRVLPRLKQRPGRRLHVLETSYLRPHASVHLVRADGQTFLVGSTRQQVALLGEIRSEAVPAPAGAKELLKESP